ncbi:precorrin-6y C5,15-methyltransferase (decarboxylating) subunit CbiE [Shimia thalassica]|uniref:precorrin-6y C5,15-methyltransferase (decarboxylating) subunit CbiE n=1 Tax=Shimia thalassica TaxID=1715693 RepID=UPI0026E33027|nr:precorrin-6y C5,15-methyltransferase (decarboxylating) subunit CbiE [Shimia thalassica]MDO6485771.1 precorrin-6y C5,15-methyltransferase (decarboxylating) subunit CbiE [Shimia thalassica]
MSETPWLTIVGLGEDGPDGLSPASRQALAEAEIVMGAERHLSLLPDLTAETVVWPVPFADGIPVLLSHRGKRAVMLASGDPFWFGAGSVMARHLTRGEWRALPVPSTMALAAAALGWPLEQTYTTGLHAAPYARLKPHLFNGTQILATLRDGAAVAELADWLHTEGFGASTLHILEALGGPRQRIRTTQAEAPQPDDIQHPVSIGIEVAGDGAVIPLASGRPDALFDNDGQITKRPVRALTLSALAPKPGEHLWDIGGGSGSIGIEWLWSHPATQATAVEIDPDRAQRIRANAARLGVDRLTVVTGGAPEALEGLTPPDAVFIGGGISQQMLETVWATLPQGARLVANAVTLEAEVLLANWHSDKGGDLMRIELAQSKPLGRKRGWKSAYPIVQWSVTK